MDGVEYHNSTHLDKIRKYWLANVHNLQVALLAMNPFDLYSSTKPERVRLGSGINRCRHIRYCCDAPPYNLTVEIDCHCPFLFRLSQLTLRRLPIQWIVPPTCWRRSMDLVIRFFFLQTEAKTHVLSRAWRGSMMGRILARFVGLRIEWVRGHTAQAQVETGRPPATKMWLDKVWASI